MDLRNKVGIVTGASRGLGARLARDLAAKGTHLALAARSVDDVERLAAELRAGGIRAIGVATDVTNRSDLEHLVERTRSELGEIDLLVNNAGIEAVAHFHQMDLDEIEMILRTNVIAVELLTRLVLPSMVQRRSGHIVNISSTSGKTVAPYMAVYSSSKHALAGFSFSLRSDLRDHGVGVTVVYPHYVSDTGMFTEWGKKPPRSMGTVDSETVARKTIQGIERNRAEVVVAPPLIKAADIFTAISPDLVAFMARRTGVYQFHRREADDRAARAKDRA